MANTAPLGELQVIIRGQTDQFKADMAKGSAIARSAMQELQGVTSSTAREAKASLSLLSEEMGVKLPRELKKFISHIDGIAPVLAGAFSAAAVVALGKVITEQVIPAIEGAAQAAAGWGEAEQEAYKGSIEANKKLITAYEELKKAKREAALAGVSGGDRKKLLERFLAEDTQDLSTRIANAQRIVSQKQEEFQKQNQLFAAHAVGQLPLDEAAAEANKAQDELRLLQIELQVTQAKAGTALGAVTKEINQSALEHAKAVASARDAMGKLWDEVQKRIAKAQAEAITDPFLKADAENKALLVSATADIEQFQKKAKEAGASAEEVVHFTTDRLRAMQDEAFANMLKAETDFKQSMEKVMKDLSSTTLGSANLGLNLPKGWTPLPSFNSKDMMQQKQSLKELQTYIQQMHTITETLDQAFSGMFTDMIVNSRSASEAFQSFAHAIMASVIQMITKMLVLYAVQRLIGFFAPAVSGNVLSSLPLGQANIGLLGATVAPPHDWPGYAQPNKPYKVGVPEVLFPHGGTAIPLSQFQGGGSPYFYVDARGSNDPMAIEMAVARSMKKALPLAVQASVAAQQQRSYRRA
jgi:hypothetical protein